MFIFVLFCRNLSMLEALRKSIRFLPSWRPLAPFPLPPSAGLGRAVASLAIYSPIFLNTPLLRLRLSLLKLFLKIYVRYCIR